MVCSQILGHIVERSNPVIYAPYHIWFSRDNASLSLLLWGIQVRILLQVHIKMMGLFLLLRNYLGKRQQGFIRHMILSSLICFT